VVSRVNQAQARLHAMAYVQRQRGELRILVVLRCLLNPGEVLMDRLGWAWRRAGAAGDVRAAHAPLPSASATTMSNIASVPWLIA
jgi:hypothetical protein